MLRITRLFFAGLFVLPFLVHSASAQVGETNQYFEVTAVDAEAYPSISLTLASKNGTQIANAPLRILLDGVEQPLIQDRSEDVALQVAFLLDPRNLNAIGIADQSHYAAIVAAMLVSIENGTLVEDLDWIFAAAAEPNGGLYNIQDWTKNPQDVVSSLLNDVGNLPVLESTSVSDSLMYALDEFRRVDSPLPQTRSLIYFAVGTEVSIIEQAAIAKLSNQASAAGIQIHTVQFVTQGQPATPDYGLEMLANQSGGRFLLVESLDGLELLFQEVFTGREQRTVDFIAPDREQSAITLQMTLADGQTVEQRVQIEPDVQGASTGRLVEDGAGVDIRTESESVDPLATPSPIEEISTQATAEPAAADTQPTAQPTALTEDAGTTQPNGAPQAEVPDRTSVTASSLISRNLLVAALPLLLVLIVLFGYQEVKDRRYRHRNFELAESAASTADFAVDESALELTEPDSMPAEFFEANMRNDLAPSGNDHGLDAILHKNGSVPSSYSAAAGRDTDRPVTDEEPTEASPLSGTDLLDIDNDATFQLRRTVEQPKLGYLLCMTNESDLPQKLPIYQLAQKPTEVRRLYIGRHSRHNTLVIKSQYVSREHAVLTQKGGRLYISDNQSTSGTFLNWKRLVPGEELLLRHKDIVTFGQVVYEFRLFGEHDPTIALPGIQHNGVPMHV